jgi:hypothetical protein
MSQPPQFNPYASPTASPFGAPQPGAGNSPFAPCPKCGARTAQKVGFTLWGGLIGPKLLSHVKCGACRTTYNGKTGRSNLTAIIIYQVVGVGICLAIAALLLLGQWAAH